MYSEGRQVRKKKRREAHTHKHPTTIFIVFSSILGHFGYPFGTQNLKSHAKALKNIDINDQKKIDNILINLDGTEQKKKLGANAILAASIASCKLAAIEKKTSLYKNHAGIKL